MSENMNTNIYDEILQDIYNDFLEKTKEVREKATPELIEQRRLKLEQAINDLENNNVEDINIHFDLFFKNLFHYLAENNICLLNKNDETAISYLNRYIESFMKLEENKKISYHLVFILFMVYINKKHKLIIDIEKPLQKLLLFFKKLQINYYYLLVQFYHTESSDIANYTKLLLLTYDLQIDLDPFYPNFSLSIEIDTKKIERINKIINELESFDDESFEFQDFVDLFKAQLYRKLNKPEIAIKILKNIKIREKEIEYTILLEEFLCKIMMKEHISIDYADKLMELFKKNNSIDKDVPFYSLHNDFLIGYIYKNNGFFDKLDLLWNVKESEIYLFLDDKFIKEICSYEIKNIENLRLYVKYFTDFFANEIIQLSNLEFAQLILEDKCKYFFKNCSIIDENIEKVTNLSFDFNDTPYFSEFTNKLTSVKHLKRSPKVDYYISILLKVYILELSLRKNECSCLFFITDNIEESILRIEEIKGIDNSKYDTFKIFFDDKVIYKILYLLNNELLKTRYEIEYETKLEHEKELQEMKLKTERSIRSFLAHTLRNTLSVGPETMKQIIALLKEIKQNHLLSSPQAEKYLNKALIRSTSILTTFNFVENLLDTFKLYSVNTDNLHQVWMDDSLTTAGEDKVETNIKRLISISILQSLSRIIYSEVFIQEFISLVGSSKKEEIRNSFLEEILFSPHDEEFEETYILKWIADNISNLEVEILTDLPKLNQKGVRHSILFSIFSELILNSVKYSDYREKIKVRWSEENDKYIFVCSNSFNPEIKIQKGSKKGIDFINQLVKDIGGVEIKITTDENIYKTEVIFSKELFE